VSDPGAVPLLLNREISWLAFNERVLAQALDPRWPVLERLKFLAITESNLDEFFMVRMAGIREAARTGLRDSEDGLSARQQLERVREHVTAFCARQKESLAALRRELAREGLEVLAHEELGAKDRRAAGATFQKLILPTLTPLTVDPGHPFPFLSNLSLNLAVTLEDSEKRRFARVKIPPTLPRLVPLPSGRFLLLESLVAAHLPELFPGSEVVSSHAFRVTRDNDIELKDVASDLLASVQREVRRRRFGAVIRLELAEGVPHRVRQILVKQLEIEDADVYEVPLPLGAGDLSALTQLDRKDLKHAPFTPAPAPALEGKGSIFSKIRAKDVLLHHPYDSFDPVVRLVEEASADPSVLAIKMTLYRADAGSPLIAALARAAENGKQVAVLVELKARFDEERNIAWAKALERAGAHVVWGVVGLKTHGKIALVVRREKGEIRRYVHLGTGNYNAVTARLYTDLGLLTCRPEIGSDATRFFNALTGLARTTGFERLVTAPHDLHASVLGWIAREAEHARAGRPCGIRAKLNALLDPRVIEALYDASRAGVPVRLLVRGMCALVPGVPGMSETIRVRSVLGRFLEHSRAIVLENGGAREVWLSSADWMPRNFFRRVEIAFPVEDTELQDRVVALLERLLDRDVRAYDLSADGVWSSSADGREAVDVQTELLEETRARVAAELRRRAETEDFAALEPVDAFA
jgi:polyphosphate kinase